jgi:hypothetical protein
MNKVNRRSLLAGGGVFVALGAARGGAAAPDAGLPAPRLDLAFAARVTIGTPIELGTVDGVRKRIIPITGGTFEGPRIRGTVIQGGADWQFIRPDGVADLSARYTLRADDGTHISVTNSGLRRGSPEVMRMIAEGKDVDPALYYFRAAGRFDVAAGPHAWLGDSIFLCTGGRYRDHVRLQFFEVL